MVEANRLHHLLALIVVWLVWWQIKQLKLNISYTEHQFLRDDELYKTTPISATFATVPPPVKIDPAWERFDEAAIQRHVAEGKIVDAQGKLYATASTTCIVFDL